MKTYSEIKHLYQLARFTIKHNTCSNLARILVEHRLMSDKIKNQQARLFELQAENAHLREALRPFADNEIITSKSSGPFVVESDEAQFYWVKYIKKLNTEHPDVMHWVEVQE